MLENYAPKTICFCDRDIKINTQHCILNVLMPLMQLETTYTRKMKDVSIYRKPVCTEPKEAVLTDLKHLVFEINIAYVHH